MQINLKWLDTNKTQNHQTEIYRALTAFDQITDATLVATVAAGTTEYTDTDVVDGSTYYYRLRFIQPGATPALSKLFVFQASPYTGPGPLTTLFGDEAFGYFGTFPVSSINTPTIDQVRSYFGLGPSTLDTGNEALHKFTIGGTIRGAFQYPVALGSELDQSNTTLKSLLTGESVTFTIGLHRWAIILPSTDAKTNTTTGISHWPGELRSMLGVITDLYTRVEDVTTGNRTGGKVPYGQGQLAFFDMLVTRYPNNTINYIVTSDWVDQTCTVIDWTAADAVYPIQSKELHVDDVVFTEATWANVLLWPLLVYIGPTTGS